VDLLLDRIHRRAGQDQRKEAETRSNRRLHVYDVEERYINERTKVAGWTNGKEKKTAAEGFLSNRLLQGFGGGKRDPLGGVCFYEEEIMLRKKSRGGVEEGGGKPAHG